MSTNHPPAWGPTGQEVYERTYSRVKDDGTNENWLETVTRVVDGNLALVPPEHILPLERQMLIDGIYNFDMLPAGRHLWTSGVPGRQFNRNCHRAGWTPELGTHFTFLFDELMKGGGVGANYSNTYLAQTDAVEIYIDLRITCDPTHPDVDEVRPDPMEHVDADMRLAVDDSREGWVAALGFLFDAATGLESTDRKALVLEVDVSAVRERGQPLAGFGGTASGPGPLSDALRHVVRILNGSVGDRLTGMDAMRIDHAIAQCVVAGNIRRSARMSIMHWQDEQIFDFISCKADHAEHWTTNISVEVDDAFFAALDNDELHATTVFQAVVEGMAVNGEPGFFNSSLASVGEHGDVRCTNPCGEIALEEWESCNLGHINLTKLSLEEPAKDSMPFFLMARFLVRATFAELLNPLQAEVEARNRRIGVGILGFQEWLVNNGVTYSESTGELDVIGALDTWRKMVVLAADTYADELGIPRPVKHTTVAPTGTVAKLAGVTEGIHPIYSRYFVRRVRYANGSEQLAELVAKGYDTEPCIYNPDTTVVLFHVRDSILDTAQPELVEQADEMSVATKLRVQELVQSWYADNAVSYTVNMADDTTTEELEMAMQAFLPSLKGTTVFPANTRPQSPYTAITEEEYNAATDHGVAQSFDECASGACPVR